MQYTMMTCDDDATLYPKMMVSRRGRRGVTMRFEPVLQISRQSFRYAEARHASLALASMRMIVPFDAGFLPLIPVVYISRCVNSSFHDAKTTPIDEDTTQRAGRTARSDARRCAGTHLHAARRPGPPPRPARSAARPPDGASELRGADVQAGARLPVRSHAR